MCNGFADREVDELVCVAREMVALCSFETGQHNLGQGSPPKATRQRSTWSLV